MSSSKKPVTEMISMIHDLPNDTVVNKRDIDKLFTYIRNKAKGDCLFESFAQHILGDFAFPLSQRVIDKSHEIREKVCTFYETFDSALDKYQEGSIDYMIAMYVNFDNDDEDGGLHTENICNELEWASVGDIYVISKLYRCNVFFFQLSGDSKSYRVIRIQIPSAKNTYFIRHVNENHYEACVPKESTPVSTSRVRKTGKKILSTSRITKKKYTSYKKSPTSKDSPKP